MVRVGEEFREILAEEIPKLKDPRVGFVTVVGVKVSPDLRHAWVAYTSLGDEKAKAGTRAALRQRFNVSVSEVDHQDLWQRAAIGVAAIGAAEYHLRQVASEIERFVDTWPAVEVLEVEMSVHAADD